MSESLANLIDMNLVNAVALKQAYQPLPPVGGESVYVTAGEDLQAVLDDVTGPALIRLERGATWEGNFRLPWREETGTVVLCTDGDLPVPKPVRPWIIPGDAAPYAKLKAQNTQEPVLFTADGAHDWTVDALDFLPNTQNPERRHVQIGRGDMDDLDQVPHRITLDRCYLHGDETLGGRRGVEFQVADGVITRCYMERFFHADEAQCIATWCGPGPFTITQNYLEAAGENYITGGADTRIHGLIPSDLYFAQNYCFKPLEWQGKPGHLVKNLFELKAMQGAVIEGNAFENCWPSGQAGHGIQFTVRNQDGGNPWNTVSDVAFRYNTVGYCLGSAFNLLGLDDTHPSVQGGDLQIHDNVIWSCESGVQINRPFVPTRIAHNTFLWAVWRSLAFGETSVAPPATFEYVDNVVGSTEYGIVGDNRAPGTDSLNFYAPGHVYTSNVIEQPPMIPYPPGQHFVPENACWVDAVYPMGSDGKECGADVARIRELMPWTVVRGRRARWGRRGGEL
jgi:hypothetical protein